MIFPQLLITNGQIVIRVYQLWRNLQCPFEKCRCLLVQFVHLFEDSQVTERHGMVRILIDYPQEAISCNLNKTNGSSKFEVLVKRIFRYVKFNYTVGLPGFDL